MARLILAAGVLFLLVKFGLGNLLGFVAICAGGGFIIWVLLSDAIRSSAAPKVATLKSAPEVNRPMLSESPAGCQISSGLIIDEPWIGKILRGEKIWEMRSSHTRKRERIALIRKGSGLVVGVATIEDSRGPLSEAELIANHEKHRVPPHLLGKWNHAWVLANVASLRKPVPYRHRAGAVKFVNLDADVAVRVAQATIRQE